MRSFQGRGEVGPVGGTDPLHQDLESAAAGQAHGEGVVVFLAAGPHQQRRNAVHHIEELELVQDGTRLVEIDLVAYDVDDDLLTIAKCNSTDRPAKAATRSSPRSRRSAGLRPA